MAAEKKKQQRRRIAAKGVVLACLVLPPGVSCAAEIELPEVGAHLTNVPEGTARFQVFDYADAYAVVVKVGDATLSVGRMDDPAPQGASVKDASYRRALVSFFSLQSTYLSDADKGQVIQVGGQEAWRACNKSLLSAPQEGAAAKPPAPALIEYSCVIYVIADSHAYCLSAKQNAPDGPPPQDLDDIIKALSSINFGPVERRSDPSGAQLKTPVVVRLANRDFYARAAQAGNQTGIVDVSFNLDERGHVRNLQKLYESSPLLSGALAAGLADTVFRVPANWKDRGMERTLFALEFQFALTSNGRCSFPQQPRQPQAEVLTVCGARMEPRIH